MDMNMNDIKIKILNKIAYCPSRYLVLSNSNYRLVFEFDDEWAGSSIKTVRIIFGEQSLDLVMQGNSITLPPIPVCERIFVGVFSDSLSSSTVEIGCIASIADSDSESIFEFTESQYDQIIKILNDTDLRQIDSISRRDNNMIILYNDGTESSVPLYDGVSVSKASINNKGELVFDFSDGKTVNCGVVKGISVSKAAINEKGELVLDFSDGKQTNCGVVKGTSGVTPSISIGTVQTLEADADPFVEITGTKENPVLNFGFPKGSSSGANFDELTDEQKKALAQIVIENLPSAEGLTF